MRLYHLSDSVGLVSRSGWYYSKSLRELQSRRQPGLLTFWGESAFTLMHMSFKKHVGLPKGLPHVMPSASPREKSVRDPQGTGAPKTEAIVVLQLILEVIAHSFCCLLLEVRQSSPHWKAEGYKTWGYLCFSERLSTTRGLHHLDPSSPALQFHALLGIHSR